MNAPIQEAGIASKPRAGNAPISAGDRSIDVYKRQHLYRALYGCRRMGITAKGAAAKDTNKGQELREAREIMARDKDFVKWIFKPQPTFMGETIPISGNGISTQ